jgi:uncharacterized membrane protein SpoIIM required for sporulation
VILDLPRFAAAERVYWHELEALLDRLRLEPGWRMSVPEIERLHYLYERCSADLVRLDAFSTEHQMRAYVESLVSRAYAEIHETRAPAGKIHWGAFIAAFPRAFRRHLGAFRLAVGLTLAGCAFGWFAIRADPEAKAVLMPFAGLMQSPAQRVAQEESAGNAKTDRLHGHKASFSAQLMTHNIQVTVMTLAFGVTWGLGTIILPHGAIEIPAILLGGQAGLVLAGALIGWGERTSRTERLRAVAHDLLAIAAGAAAMLVWAGIVEAFVSQYHQPVLPYSLKIAFGVLELAALSIFLARVGRR